MPPFTRCRGASAVRPCPCPISRPGPGNCTAHVDAAGGHAVVAWTHGATAESQTTTTSARGDARQEGHSAPPRTWRPLVDGHEACRHWSGSQVSAQRVVVSGSGDADVLFTELHTQGYDGRGRAGREGRHTDNGRLGDRAHLSELWTGRCSTAACTSPTSRQVPAATRCTSRGSSRTALRRWTSRRAFALRAPGTTASAAALHTGVLGEGAGRAAGGRSLPRARALRERAALARRQPG